MKVKTEEILRTLKEDSKLSYVALSKQLGVTEAAIRKRIKNLVKKGYFNYTIDINYRKLGYYISTFIGFDAKAEYYHTILEKLQQCEEKIDFLINSIYQTSIDHDFMIACSFRNNSDLTQFLKILENTEGVLKVCPAIINQKIR